MNRTVEKKFKELEKHLNLKDKVVGRAYMNLWKCVKLEFVSQTLTAIRLNDEVSSLECEVNGLKDMIKTEVGDQKCQNKNK